MSTMGRISKMVKCKTMAQVAFRNEQFEYIKKITNEFIFNGFPVLSLDTKKKELIRWYW